MLSSAKNFLRKPERKFRDNWKTDIKKALQKIKNTAIQTEDISLIEHSIIKEAKFMLKEKKEISTTELYDGGIMEMLIQNNWITTISKHYTSLVEIFEKNLVWDSSSNAWRLKE